MCEQATVYFYLLVMLMLGLHTSIMM